MLSPLLKEIKGEPFIIDMMYAGTRNMTGRAVYEEIGLGNRAFVHRDLYDKLQLLVPWLNRHHRKMKICDAYRPPLAHQIMKEIIPLPGFFASCAERSQHCHGTAVDVVLTDLEGRELAYPTLVDAYDEVLAREVQAGNDANFNRHLQKARQDYDNPAMSAQIANREELRALMESIGLEAIGSEWWHYDLPGGRGENYPLLVY